MNKFYIVEDIRFDSKFKTPEEIKELEWKSDNGLGVWSSEGRTEDERINNLWEKVQDYMESILHLLSTVTTDPTR